MAEELKKDAEMEEALTVMFGKDGAEGIVERTKEKPAPKKEGESAPPAEPVPPTIAEPPAAPAKVAKPKAAPRAKKPEPVPAAIDLTERDRIVAEAAVRGAAEAGKARGKDPLEDIPAKDDLTDAQRETIAAMDFLGKKDAKYATLAERTMSYWKKEQEYAARWLKDNPGKEYDPKSDDHAEFYEKHEPEYVEADLDKARKDQEKAALEASLEEKVERRLSEKEQLEKERRRQTDESSQVQTESESAQLKLIKEIAPDAEKFFVADGKTQLTEEQWKAFAEEDPAAAKVLKRSADYLSRHITELERLNRYPKTYPPDFQNAIHQSLAATILSAEEQILALPPKEQLDHGKQFITQGEWGNKVHRIISDKKTSEDEKRTALRELNGRYWMLQPAHVKNLIIAEHRKKAAAKLADFREVEEGVKKKAGKTATETTPPSVSTEPPPPQAKAAAAPAKKAPREVEPTMPTGGDVMPTGDKGASNGASALETLTSIGI